MMRKPIKATQNRSVIPLSSNSSSLRKCELPDVADGVICLSSNRQQDGFGGVLEKCSSVLSLSLLDPVAIDLECTCINELTDRLDSVWVTLDYLPGDRLGTAVAAVDPHCGEHSHANDLMEKVDATGWCLYVKIVEVSWWFNYLTVLVVSILCPLAHCLYYTLPSSFLPDIHWFICFNNDV